MDKLPREPPRSRSTSVAQHLNDLKEDLSTLLQYCQKLRAENDSLKGILGGSVVFFETEDKEKHYRSITGSSVSRPTLRTVQEWGDPDSQTATGQSSGEAARAEKYLSTTVATITGGPVHLPSAVPNGNHVQCNGTECWLPRNPKQSRSRQAEDSVCGSGDVMKKAIDNVDSNTVLLTSDLAAILVQWRKLHDSVAELKSESSTSISTMPNVDEANLIDISVVGCERKGNNIVFIVRTAWTNGQKFELYRKYEDFFTLQASMTELMPVKPRQDVSSQMFPELPIKDHVLTALGRFNSESALEARVKMLENFCKAVVFDMAGEIEEAVYRSSVLTFFTSRPEDIEIQGPRKESALNPNSDSLPAGAQFVECEVTTDYEAGSDTEMTVKCGETVAVLSTDATGWSLVVKQDKTGKEEEAEKIGYIPTSYLQELEDGLVLENSEKLEEQYLGFLSSVAVANDTRWLETNSDLLDAPNLKPVLTLTRATPETAPLQNPRTPALADPPRPKAKKAKAITNLSILKTTTDPEIRTKFSSHTAVRRYKSADDNKGSASMPSHGRPGIRDRCQKSDNRDLPLARLKALAMKSGSTDWGKRSNSVPEEEDTLRADNVDTV